MRKIWTTMQYDKNRRFKREKTSRTDMHIYGIRFL